MTPWRQGKGRTAHPARERAQAGAYSATAAPAPPDGDAKVGDGADPTLRRRRWLPVGPNTRRRLNLVRLWAVHMLSSPTALAATVLVAVAGLLLAFYVALAQINLTNCLAAYNEAAALSTQARAQAAAEDRALDKRALAIDADDRRLDRQDDAALDTVLASMGGPAFDVEAFKSLRRLRAATAEARRVNDVDRYELASARREVELRRAANPPPAPPSQSCG